MENSAEFSIFMKRYVPNEMIVGRNGLICAQEMLLINLNCVVIGDF